jgi:hypothetical protein
VFRGWRVGGSHASAGFLVWVRKDHDSNPLAVPAATGDVPTQYFFSIANTPGLVPIDTPTSVGWRLPAWMHSM